MQNIGIKNDRIVSSHQSSTTPFSFNDELVL